MSLAGISWRSHFHTIRARLPGRVDAQKSHCLKARLLRKIRHKVQQGGSVVELAQVDAMSHRLAVRHDAHLQDTRDTRDSTSYAGHVKRSRASLLRMRSCLMVQMWHHVLYTVSKEGSAAKEDVTSKRPGCSATRLSSVSPLLERATQPMPDQRNHNRNQPRVQTENPKAQKSTQGKI